MTSNAGSNLNNNSIGFGKGPIQDSNKMVDALKNLFRPEFLNRVDEIIPFDSLTENELAQIIDLLLDQTNEALKSKDIIVKIDDKAKKYLLSKGTDLKYGARPLRRTIQNYIEDSLADMILKGELKAGQKVQVTTNESKEALEFKINN
jgi:ATP-dependent Clp protease ATP-binding subunit ClpA